MRSTLILGAIVLPLSLTTVAYGFSPTASAESEMRKNIATGLLEKFQRDGFKIVDAEITNFACDPSLEFCHGCTKFTQYDKVSERSVRGIIYIEMRNRKIVSSEMGTKEPFATHCRKLEFKRFNEALESNS